MEMQINYGAGLGISLDSRDQRRPCHNLANQLSGLVAFLGSTFRLELRPRLPRSRFRAPHAKKSKPLDDRSGKRGEPDPGFSHSDERLSSPAESYSVWFRELYSRELENGELGNGQDPLMKALIALHPGDLDLIVMRHVEQMDTREIAIRFQLDEPEVKRRLLRALLLLRSLKDQFQSDSQPTVEPGPRS